MKTRILTLVLAILILVAVSGCGCNKNVTDEIWLVGHITDPDESIPNDYLVLAFKENEEVGRTVTTQGGFERAKTRTDDGYFEIKVPNEYQLTGCDLRNPFKFHYGKFKAGFLKGKTSALWHYFEDIEVGREVAWQVESRGIAYTIVAYPDKTAELSQSALVAGSAYLDESGEVKFEEHAPSQIWLVGHIHDENNPIPNNYLVILFKEGQEIARAITQLGRFDSMEDAKSDGYFEISIPNEYNFTQSDFEQFSFVDRSDSTLSDKTFMWHPFESLEAGAKTEIRPKDKNFRYTLAVMPTSVDLMSGAAIQKEGSTYLSEDGQVMVHLTQAARSSPKKTSVLVKILRWLIGLFVPYKDTPAKPVSSQDLSFKSGQLYGEITYGDPQDFTFDVNNCGGETVLDFMYKKQFVYYNEYSFDVSAGTEFPILLMPQLEATIGYINGQTQTEEFALNGTVPRDSVSRYRIILKEKFQPGEVRLGKKEITLPFKVKTGILIEVSPEPTVSSCP